MIYYLVDFMRGMGDFPGVGMFQYISFRSAGAVILALLIAIIFGKSVIHLLQRRQIGEQIRNLGLEGQLQKRGTPTMGGLIILGAILAPVLLLADLSNVYIQLMVISTVWLGFIGFMDDYIKVSRNNKKGLSGYFKIAGQVVLGLIVGTTMWLSGDILVRQKVQRTEVGVVVRADDLGSGQRAIRMSPSHKATIT
ncbi:MAG: phospho-N-acetylmuramoyl-pentapeptide-transferase, partial [Mucinivorans sp.]